MIPVVIKPNLCWRAPGADVELFTDLFRYGYHEGMHKSAFGKTKDKWEKFTEDLFATQHGFIGKDKIAVKAVTPYISVIYCTKGYTGVSNSEKQYQNSVN